MAAGMPGELGMTMIFVAVDPCVDRRHDLISPKMAHFSLLIAFV
jgi:hypothetical protein